MGYSTQTYSTQDELEFLNELHRDGKLGVLKRLQSIYQSRHWEGAGMRVDGAAVMEHIETLLQTPVPKAA